LQGIETVDPLPVEPFRYYQYGERTVPDSQPRFKSTNAQSYSTDMIRKGRARWVARGDIAAPAGFISALFGIAV
jgi:hypothetical protein